MKNDFKQSIENFYKINSFKIFFVIIFTILILLSLHFLVIKCGLRLTGSSPDYKCGDFAHALAGITWLYTVFIGFLQLPFRFLFGVDNSAVYTYIPGIITHAFISYNLACFLWPLWDKLTMKMKKPGKGGKK